MKTEILNDVDNKDVVRFIPETEEDIEKLREMENRQELDTRHSFSDDPDVWE